MLSTLVPPGSGLGHAVRRYGLWRFRRRLCVHAVAVIGGVFWLAASLHRQLPSDSLGWWSGSVAAALGSAVQEWRWLRALQREWARAHGPAPSGFELPTWFDGL